MSQIKNNEITHTGNSGTSNIVLGSAGQVTMAGDFTPSRLKLGSDAAGDTMYSNGTQYVRLAKGTAGQVLKMNAGATAPEWGTDVGGKVLQFKYTQTQIAYGDGNWAWPTSETDLSGHSIAMTKQSSGTSYYLFTVSTGLHYNAGSIDGRFFVHKDSSLLSPQHSSVGMGYLHSPTQYVNEFINQRMVVTSDSGTYKLRIQAGSANLQLARGCFTTFTITEFE